MDNNISKTDYEAIIPVVINSFFWERMTAEQTAKRVGVSCSYVSYVIRITKLMKANNVDGIIELRESNSSITKGMVEVCAKTLGFTLPDEYFDFEKERDERILRERRESAQAARESISKTIKGKENIAEDVKTIVETMNRTTPLWAQSILLNQAKVIEQFGDINDAVIPKYARDIVDAINKLDTHLVQLINKL